MPDFTATELRDEIRRASDRMAPISLADVQDRPAVDIRPDDDVFEAPVIDLERRSSRRRWWITGLAAAAVAIVIVAVSMFDQGDEVRTNDDPPAADDAPGLEEGPSTDEAPNSDDTSVTETGAEIFVEPAGSGPVLVWEEVPVPADGGILWLAHDDDRFILLDTLGALFTSEDGRSWDPVSTIDRVPNLYLLHSVTDPYAGRFVIIDLASRLERAVKTVDITTGSVFSTPLAELLSGTDLPCEPASIDDGCAVEERGVIGPRGAVIWMTLTATRDPGEPLDTPESTLRTAWHSDDGESWTRIPATGPWTPDAPRGPIGAAIDDGFVVVQPEMATGCRGANVWFSSDGLGWDLVQEWCMDTTLAEDTVFLELTSWGNRAIASFGGDDGWAWSGASTSEKPFWVVSRSGVARLEHEPLPLVAGVGTIDAGGAGIAVIYETWDPESEDDPERTNTVIEYSPDGQRWSRRVMHRAWVWVGWSSATRLFSARGTRCSSARSMSRS